MNKNKNYIKKAIIVTALAFSISLSPIQAKPSLAWDAIPAAQFKQMLEEIADRIKGIIMGALKKQAAQMLNKQATKAVSGGKGGGGLIIDNWQAYLVKQPQSNTKLYMNDYLSKITSGKGSSTGYKSEGFGGLGGLLGGSGGTGSGGGSTGTGGSGAKKSTGSSGGMLGGLLGKSGSGSMISGLLGGKGGGSSYSSQLVQMAKKETVDQKQPKMTLEGDPTKMFAQGNFKLFDSFLSGINNPWSFVGNAQTEYQKKLAEEKKIAQTKAISYQGFKGVGEGKNGKGKIKTPGSLVKDKTANTQDIGNKIIASATHPEEVISAIVSQMISQMMSQGMGSMQQMMKQVGLSNQAGQQNKNNAATQGPGATFKPTSSGISLNSLKSLLK
jgi:hypothetical protein